MDTLLLTRSEVAQLLEPQRLLAALREAFAAYSTGRSVDAMRIPMALPAGEVPVGASGMLLAPGLGPGIPAYSVKVHAKFPGSDPAIRGVLVLNDLTTGAPLALMESRHLTALRTGLAGALGAEVLSRLTARCVVIIGAGAQGRSQLAALRLVRQITAVRVFDNFPGAAERFASDPACDGWRSTSVCLWKRCLTEPTSLSPRPGPKSRSCSGTICGPACTSPRSVLISRTNARLRPTPCAAKVVVDDRRLAVEMGAVGGAGFGREAFAPVGRAMKR